jgi:tetratricopeptide (TPR) repeat protein
MNLSLERSQAKDYQGCVDAARQALKLKPDMAEAYNNIGWCSGSMGKWDEGIRNVREALRIKPDFTLASGNLAWMQAEKQKGSSPPPAAAPLTPADSFLQHSLDHAQAGRYQECVDAARQALKVKPDIPEAYNNIGWCQAKMGKWDDGIGNTREALRLKPDFQLASKNLAWMLAEKAKVAGGPASPK